MAAATSAAVGLATLTTFMLIGWVAAPHASFGEDIGDVFRVAVQAWLVGHHVGFAVPGGHVSMLPMGLLVLPGLLLYRAGRWLARTSELPRLRNVFQAGAAIAGPYAAICGTLALVAHTETVQPSMPQALVTGFGLAFVAGGLGTLRQLLIDKDIARRRLLRLMPARSRSLLVGTSSATFVLLLSGLALFVVGLVANAGEAAAVTSELGPGIVGGVLLVILQLLYLPNAVVFGMSYAAGPGFSVGAETVVAPTGIIVGPLPAFPMLAALPDNGPAPVLSLAALAAPFVAGGVGGWLTLRSAPALVSEAAPMWGFVCGVSTGVVCAVLALLAGGPLGVERLTVMGPSAWQVGLVVALEVGLAAAVVGWVANWLHFRRAGQVAAGTGEAPKETASGEPEDPVVAGAVPGAAEGATDPAAGQRPGRASGKVASRPHRGWLRVPRLRWGRAGGSPGEEPEELFGISYEAEGETGAGDPAEEEVPERRAREAGAERQPVVFDEPAPVTYLADRGRNRDGKDGGRQRGR